MTLYLTVNTLHHFFLLQGNHNETLNGGECEILNKQLRTADKG